MLKKSGYLALSILLGTFVFSSCKKDNSVPVVTVTDIDGNIYTTVKIGSQLWMAENLRVNHYRNGDEIPEVKKYSEWEILTSDACCVYNNDSTKLSVYGRMYNGYAALDQRNICPSGWHIPDKEEWQELINYLGGRGVAGGKLKEKGTQHWVSPNTTSDTLTGFNALPGGIRAYHGTFNQIGGTCGFWSATELYPTDDDGVADSTSVSTGAWSENLMFIAGAIQGWPESKVTGLSIRCIKD
jgi:uncharacterized protein (TIGR02145 family)